MYIEVIFVNRVKPQYLKVVVGELSTDMMRHNRSLQRSVSSYIIPKNFLNNYFESDIALLKLRKPIVFNEYIYPACLPALGKLHFINLIKADHILLLKSPIE